jgi:hypothetical protein
MGGASRQFRYFGDEDAVFFAPIDNDFVLDHSRLLSLAFEDYNPDRLDLFVTAHVNWKDRFPQATFGMLG